MYGNINDPEVKTLDGTLAERVLKRVGKTEGKVEIAEGYFDDWAGCDTCSYVYWAFEILVDGVTKYNCDGDSEDPESLARFNDWLNEVE